MTHGSDKCEAMEITNFLQSNFWHFWPKKSTTPSATDIHQLQQHLRLKHSVLDGKTSEQFKLKKMVWLMFRFLDKMMTFHCQIYDIDQ